MFVIPTYQVYFHWFKKFNWNQKSHILASFWLTISRYQMNCLKQDIFKIFEIKILKKRKKQDILISDLAKQVGKENLALLCVLFRGFGDQGRSSIVDLIAKFLIKLQYTFLQLTHMSGFSLGEMQVWIHKMLHLKCRCYQSLGKSTEVMCINK